MSGLASPKKTLEILKAHHFRFRKGLGQNFLIDQNILNKIVAAADLSPQDVVLEIGAGIGTLTLELAQKAKAVLAVEFDRTLLGSLKETLKGALNVKIVASDALKLDLKTLPQETPWPNKLVSNLPYNIATPLIAKVLEEFPQIKTLVVMVQKEVGERIVAKPGGKDYGAFTLKVQYYAEPKMVAKVSRNVFLPPPQVDSAIVKLERLASPRVKVREPVFLFKVITAAFSKRRKTLKNALASYTVASQKEVVEALKKAKIDPQRRGETLTLEEFAHLSETLENLKSN